MKLAALSHKKEELNFLSVLYCFGFFINFAYIVSTLLELWRYIGMCNTTCTGGPSLECEYLFYIVIVLCSENIITCSGIKFTKL